MLVLLAPLLALVAALVLLTDGWPILHGEDRLGLGRRRFVLFKFRTQSRSARHWTPERALEAGDLIRCGRFLRDTRLDELPELWSVVRGETSFLGPQPERPLLRPGERSPGSEQRYAVRPGLLGPSQIFLPRGAHLRICTAFDGAWFRGRRSAGAAATVLLLQITLGTCRKIALRVGELVLDDVLRGKLYRQGRQRDPRRLAPGSATVSFAPGGDFRAGSRLTLLDIDEEALVVHAARPVEQGAAARARLELVLPGEGRRVRSARCLVVVARQRRREQGYALVLRYWPLTPWSDYVLHQYFLRDSLISPRARSRRAASRARGRPRAATRLNRLKEALAMDDGT